jgi:branched-chain amino acid transport system ATP-binding protein
MLEVKKLKVSYGRIPILHGVDFNVSDGEFVGILGHNGMGKTTLLKALVGLLKPNAGEIRLKEKNITKLPPHKRNRNGIGYVAQGRDIFPNLTVRENLRTGILMHKGLRAKEAQIIDEILEDFPRLETLLNRRGGVLSGGEQQILALARCLCGSPEVLLLDEPTEGIQPSIVDEIIEILKNLRVKRGLTVVLVEQNLEFISALSDRVYVIRRGVFTGELSPDQLANPEIVQEFVGMN